MKKGHRLGGDDSRAFDPLAVENATENAALNVLPWLGRGEKGLGPQGKAIQPIFEASR